MVLLPAPLEISRTSPSPISSFTKSCAVLSPTPPDLPISALPRTPSIASHIATRLSVRRRSVLSRWRSSRSCEAVRRASLRSIDVRSFSSTAVPLSLLAPCPTWRVYLERDNDDGHVASVERVVLGNCLGRVRDDRGQRVCLPEDHHRRLVWALGVDVLAELEDPVLVEKSGFPHLHLDHGRRPEEDDVAAAAAGRDLAVSALGQVGQEVVT